MCLEKCTKFSSQFKQSHNCFSPAGRFLFSKGQWVNVLGLVGHIRSGQMWPWAIACQYLYLDSHHFLECRSVVRLASYFPHRWIKIHTVEDQDKLKLQTFTASSTILLSEIGFLFPFFFFSFLFFFFVGMVVKHAVTSETLGCHSFASCQGTELCLLPRHRTCSHHDFLTYGANVQNEKEKWYHGIILRTAMTSGNLWKSLRDLQGPAGHGSSRWFFLSFFPIRFLVWNSI